MFLQQQPQQQQQQKRPRRQSQQQQRPKEDEKRPDRPPPPPPAAPSSYENLYDAKPEEEGEGEDPFDTGHVQASLSPPARQEAAKRREHAALVRSVRTGKSD